MESFSKLKNFKKYHLALVIIFIITVVSVISVVNLSAASVTSGNFVVDYNVQNSWNSGAIVNVEITNNGSPVQDWTVKWTYSSNQKIINMWNASYTQSGSSVTAKNSAWNGSIPTNGSQSFGFNISYSGDNSNPSSFTVTSSESSIVTTVVTSTSTPAVSTPIETTTPIVTASTVTSTVESSPTYSKVACIGDSITQGWGNNFTTPYPKALQNLLGSDYTVKNYGVSGTTMLKKGNSPYWNTSQYKDSSNWLPDIVIIMLGSNDAKSYNWQYKSEFLANSIEMINHYKDLASHPIVYVATSPTVYNGTTGNYGITNQIVTGEVVPLTKQASKETECVLIDVNTATQGMPQNFPDYVHPNDDGYLIIAKTVLNIIGK
ncbi:MAG: cellulose binding domain-containing protein [Clostridiales bacterium]